MPEAVAAPFAGPAAPAPRPRTMRVAGAILRFLSEVSALVVALVVLALAAVGLAYLGPGLSEAGNAIVVEELVEVPARYLVPILLLIGFGEELVFRVAPLGLFLYLSRRFGMPPRWRTRGAVALALASSALFGFLHGNLQAVYLQGPVGLALACAFLWRGRRRGYWRAALLVMLAHTLYDLAVIGALRTFPDLVMG